MSGRSRRKNANSRKKKKPHVLTDHKLADVKVWKERIDSSIQGALSCYEWMEQNNLLDNQHALTALVKHVENTTEAIKKVDTLTKRELFRLLEEIPEDGDDKGAMTWKNMIKTRERLAHDFYDVDNSIVLNAVKSDFPKLADLFSSLLIEGGVTKSDGSTRFTVEGSDIAKLRVSSFDVDALAPGNSTVLALYAPHLGWTIGRQFVDSAGWVRQFSLSRSPDDPHVEWGPLNFDPQSRRQSL